MDGGKNGKTPCLDRPRAARQSCQNKAPLCGSASQQSCGRRGERSRSSPLLKHLLTSTSFCVSSKSVLAGKSLKKTTITKPWGPPFAYLPASHPQQLPARHLERLECLWAKLGWDPARTGSGRSSCLVHWSRTSSSAGNVQPQNSKGPSKGAALPRKALTPTTTQRPSTLCVNQREAQGLSWVPHFTWHHHQLTEEGQICFGAKQTKTKPNQAPPPFPKPTRTQSW